MSDDLVKQLRGWRETDGMSDDARRKLWLMRQAADRIEALEKECERLEEVADDYAREVGDAMDYAAECSRD